MNSSHDSSPGFGAPRPVTVEFFSDEVLRRANALSFGVARMPTFDLARSRSVICFGADFLGTWNSPVAQSRAYGEMRRGRPGERGRLIQVESRMSQTGANADEWIPARPGTEGALALGLAHVLLAERLLPRDPARAAGALLKGWNDGLTDYTPKAVEQITGVEASRIVRLAQDLAAFRPAVALVGGAPLAHTNGLFTALAVNALNALLGSVEQPGGFFFTPEPDPTARVGSADLSSGQTSSVRALAEQILSNPASVQVLLFHHANPIFSSPPAWRVRAAVEQVPFIVSFGSFLDETSVMADLILPDHAPLEAWLDDVPESGTTRATVSLAPPAVRPLHDTRATPDVLLDIAHRLGGAVARALPWERFDAMLRDRFIRLVTAEGRVGEAEREEIWKRAQADGGWWHDGISQRRRTTGRVGTPARGYTPPEPLSTRNLTDQVEFRGAQVNYSGPWPASAAGPLEFDGDRGEYPFHLLPYASPMLFDRSLAHLPWMQEIPDALTSAMWGSWVELNPRSAERLNIGPGDLVEVRSAHGRLEVPVVISPGVAPDVVAMPVGQGTNTSRGTRVAGARTRFRCWHRSSSPKPARWRGPPRACVWRASEQDD